jgi:hypothetical protein
MDHWVWNTPCCQLWVLVTVNTYSLIYGCWYTVDHVFSAPVMIVITLFCNRNILPLSDDSIEIIGMLHHVGLVRTDVSEERSISYHLGDKDWWANVTANVVPSSAIHITLMKEMLCSSETLLLTRVIWHKSQKTAFFLVTAVKTSNLNIDLIAKCSLLNLHRMKSVVIFQFKWLSVCWAFTTTYM